MARPANRASCLPSARSFSARHIRLAAGCAALSSPFRTSHARHSHRFQSPSRHGAFRLSRSRQDHASQPRPQQPRRAPRRRHRQRHERGQHRCGARPRRRRQPVAHRGAAGGDDQWLHLLHAARRPAEGGAQPVAARPLRLPPHRGHGHRRAAARRHHLDFRDENGDSLPTSPGSTRW